MPLYLKLISDIHEEFKDPDSEDGYFHLEIPSRPTDKDTILAVAGDLNSSMYNSGPKKIVDSLERWSKQYKAVVYVMGNHDHWGGTIDRTPEKVDELIAERDLANVHHLNKSFVVIDGFRFLGMTMWGDFAKDPITEWDLNQRWADLQRIRVAGGKYRRLRAMDVSTIHHDQTQWLYDILGVFKDLDDGIENIVVTHHLPHLNSVATRFLASPFNVCYQSDQTRILKERDIKFWCHGHTHDSVDYEIHGTRVVCNPHGYYLCEVNEEFESEILFKLRD